VTNDFYYTRPTMLYVPKKLETGFNSAAIVVMTKTSRLWVSIIICDNPGSIGNDFEFSLTFVNRESDGRDEGKTLD